MRIKALALWECPNQDEEVGAKHIANTERFQPVSREPISPLVGEPRELIDFDEELLEDPTIASLYGVDTTTQICEESSQKEDEENDVDTLIAM